MNISSLTPAVRLTLTLALALSLLSLFFFHTPTLAKISTSYAAGARPL